MRHEHLETGGLELLARAPRPGDVLAAEFRLPSAAPAAMSLCSLDLKRGCVVLATLPSVLQPECIQEAAALVDHLRPFESWTTTAFVSGDPPRLWKEATLSQSHLLALAYSLHDAPRASREAFERAFGVTVAGRRAPAHGLFVLKDGRFLFSEVLADAAQPARHAALPHGLLRAMGPRG
jgi:hypothetical protein